MRSKVFVSCGQNSVREREIAVKIGRMLEERGFDIYVAIDVQTILEINPRIIRELKNSDCYLLVNFCREQMGEGYRGSLFANQELAIAYALGFERILVINQEGVLQEGMLGQIGINTERFLGSDDCCPVVERALDRSGWTCDYSRRLTADHPRFSDELLTYSNLIGRFLYIDIQNHRPDIAALEATARLSELGLAGQTLQPSPIRSPLKATGRPGFSHTIFPKSHEAFDLLCVGMYRNQSQFDVSAPAVSGSFVQPVAGHQKLGVLDLGVFLNTALDLAGAQRLTVVPGKWRLRYEFFAIDFPVLSVLVELTLTDWDSVDARIVSQEVV
jgi:hypothetical protein